MTIPAVTDTTIPPGVLTELTRLRAEFPGHWIGTEIIPGRGARYVARARQHDVHPHTVITPTCPSCAQRSKPGGRTQPSREEAGSRSRGGAGGRQPGPRG